MQTSRLRARYSRIMAFFFRSTVGLAFWEVVLPAIGLRWLSRRTRSKRFRGLAAEFRQLAVRMGGVMIKMGQFLSARLDVLPGEVIEELEGLQDEVPPEDFDEIRALAEAELGMSLEAAFERFEPEPMAAASLGQVHRATLRADEREAGQFREVVVKIQRPDIEQLIDVDFAALRRFGGWLQRYPPIRMRVDVLALIKELSDTVHREIDYIAEGQNAEMFAANFEERPRIRVPRVAWSLTKRRVLTLENVFDIKITDYDVIEAAGIDRAAVARVLFDTYLKQIFEDHFFHADPHPGNLFIAPTPATSDRPASWRLTFVDFGMVGTVPEDLQRGLVEVLVSIGTRDPKRMVQAYKTLGVLLPGADTELLERAEAQLFDRFWGMSMSELRRVHPHEMGKFAMQFRDLMYSMPFQLPHNMLLLGRTLAILSGMCTGLDPNFNVWAQLAPYAQKLLTEQGQTGWQTWLDRLGELAKVLVALPSQTSRVLATMEAGRLEVTAPEISRQIVYLEAAVNRVAGSLIFLGLLLGGVLLYNRSAVGPAYAFWALAAIALFAGVFFVRGHRR